MPAGIGYLLWDTMSNKGYHLDVPHLPNSSYLPMDAKRSRAGASPDESPNHLDLPPERWAEADALLDAALDRPTEARAAFVEEACGGDRALQQKVEALLTPIDDAEEEAVGAGKAGWDDFLQQVAEDEQDRYARALAGRRFGPWLLDRELGHGGMGLVYLARHEETGKAAAVKLVPPALASAELLKRFEAERRALAKLPHAGIAGLLDGGVSEDGTPFFAMEYADGEPITAYCARHRLGLQERVRLFLQVCEAVQAAHQRLVVHRDLKPSNVFVVEEGGRPLVKLLDFGIAKVLAEDDEEGDAGLPVTATGERLMTPAYASPEQVTGGAVTTATDVYALGVLFFELVTGQRPYRVKMEGSRALIAVAEADVVRPSTAVARTNRSSDDARDREESRNARGGLIGLPEPRRLVQRLRGDLDAICLKALRKEAEERYPTAQSMADDLDRYLHGLPVTAQRGSASYRASKYVRRHRWGVAATGVLMLFLVAYAITLTFYAERLRTEAAKAQQVATFLTDLFELSDPDIAQGAAVTAREFLDRSARQLEGTLTDQPLVQAEFSAVLGRIYLNLGLYEEGRPLLETALVTRRQHLKAPHPDLASVLHDLGITLSELGDAGQARLHYDKALAMWRALSGASEEEAKTLIGLGLLSGSEGEYESAKQFYREALAVIRSQTTDDHPTAAQALNNLAKVFSAQSRYAEAEPLQVEAAEMYERLFGLEHWDAAVAQSNLAMLMTYLDRPEAADSLHRLALAAKEKILGEDHPHIASSLSGLGRSLHARGLLGKAEPLYQRALKIRMQRFGDQHPAVGLILQRLGDLAYDQGRFASAESLYLRVLEIDTINQGGDPSHVGIDLTRLGRVAYAQGNYDVADFYYREAVDLLQKGGGGNKMALSAALTGYGRLLTETGKATQAEPGLRRALEISLERLPDGHRWTAEVHSVLGACLLRLKHYKDAETHLLKGFDVLQEKRGPEHRLTLETAAHLATLYKSWGNPNKAAEPASGR